MDMISKDFTTLVFPDIRIPTVCFGLNSEIIWWCIWEWICCFNSNSPALSFYPPISSRLAKRLKLTRVCVSQSCHNVCSNFAVGNVESIIEDFQFKCSFNEANIGLPRLASLSIYLDKLRWESVSEVDFWQGFLWTPPPPPPHRLLLPTLLARRLGHSEESFWFINNIMMHSIDQE